LKHDNVGDGDDLLLCAFEIPCFLGLAAQRLDRVHHVLRLVHECLAKIDRPCEVCVHFGDQCRKFSHGLHVLIPGLVVHFRDIVCVFHESCRLDDFHRIGRRGEHDGNQRIRMKRDRLAQLLQVRRALFCGR
jgi:hypothetical protein